MWMWLLYGLLGTIVSVSMAFFRRQVKRHQVLLAVVTKRSAHCAPTHRGAGIVWLILWGLFLMLAYAWHRIGSDSLWLWLPTSLVVGGVGFIDDCRPLSIQCRLIAQWIVAVQFVVTLYIVSFGEVSWVAWYGWGWMLGLSMLLVLCVMWSINLFNFMDGLDGLAAMEACFLFGVGGFFLWQQGAFLLAYVGWGWVAMALGFLVWNRPPARLFMGDAGSYLLGFLIATWILISWYQYHMSLIIWFILYGLFIVDSTLTLLRRMIAGEKWYQAHHRQAIHRLYRGGWTHHAVLWWSVGINIGLSGIAWWVYRVPNASLWGGLIALTSLLALYAWVEVRYPICWVLTA